MADGELAELKRLMQVGFAEQRGHVDQQFAKVHGRLDVQDEQIKGLRSTQKRHEGELRETAARRWPLPVLAAIGGLGGIVSVAAWAMPHK